MSKILGATFGIGIKKRLLKIDHKKKKQRTYVTSGNTIKRICPLPLEVDDCQVQIKLRRQVSYGIDFIYDTLTEEMKLFVRYTMIQVNNSNTPVQLNYLTNYQPPNMIIVDDIESITSSGSIEHLIGKIFFNLE